MNKIRTFQDIISALGEGRRLTNIDLKFGGHNYNYIYTEKVFDRVNVYEKKEGSKFCFPSEGIFSFDENYWRVKQYKLHEILEEFNVLNRKYINVEFKIDRIKLFIRKVGRLSWGKYKYIDIFDLPDKIYRLTFEDLFIADDWEVVGADYKEEFNISKLFNISEDKSVKGIENNESSEM